MNGQIDQQLYRPLKGIQSFRPQKCGLPCGLSFFMEGQNMGIRWTTNEISATKQNAYMKEHCSKCIDYTHKGAIGQGMSDMDYTPGVWNFDTCYTTCWHDRRTKHNDAMRIYSNKYYWDKKKEQLANERRKGK